MSSRRFTYTYDEEDESEATRIFLANSMKEYNKAFPAPKSELPKGRLSRNVSTMPKLSTSMFDESHISSSGRPREAELFEAKESVRILEKKLKSAREDLEESKKAHENTSNRVSQLLDEITQLKKAATHRELEVRNSLDESSVMQNSASAEREQLYRVALKLYNWRTKDRRQLETFTEILKENNMWTTQNRRKILDSYSAVQPVDLSDELISDLYRGSVLDYDGADGLHSEEQNDEMMESIVHTASETVESADVDTTSLLFQAPKPRATFADPNLEQTAVSNRSRIMLSPISSATTVDRDEENENDFSQVSVFDQTINSTTVDYENYETIQRLETENATLKRDLDIARGRAKSAMLIKEQKLNLEAKNKYLTEKFEETVKELMALRQATANEMVGENETSARLDHAKKVADKAAELQRINDDLAREVQSLRAQVMTLEGNNMLVTADFDNERARSCGLMTENQNLEAILAQKESELRASQEESGKTIGELRANCEALRTEVEELRRRQGQEPATDAGETTQIFHMRSNPLEIARREMLEREDEEEKNRKRKRSQCSDCGEDADPEAKRSKEQVAVLEEQLRKAESAQKALDYQRSLIVRYREVTTALTGYQIKMRDDEWVVASTLGEEPQDSFTFKCEGTQVMLLSRDDGISGESAKKWKDDMDRYIGQWGSVPAFLSRVTLTLAEENELTTTRPVDPSFSVLTED